MASEDWDEAVVETEEYEYPENTRSPKPAHGLLADLINYVSNPWVLLLLVLLVYHVYTRHIGFYVDLLVDRVRNALHTGREEAPKSSEVFREQQERLALVRANLQSKYDEEARRKNEEVREKEEQKRRLKLQQDEIKAGLKGQHVLGRPSHDNSNNTTWRPDYNPLAPGGGGSSYRPSRRRPCPGGGCG